MTFREFVRALAACTGCEYRFTFFDYEYRGNAYVGWREPRTPEEEEESHASILIPGQHSLCIEHDADVIAGTTSTDSGPVFFEKEGAGNVTNWKEADALEVAVAAVRARLARA